MLYLNAVSKICKEISQCIKPSQKMGNHYLVITTVRNFRFLFNFIKSNLNNFPGISPRERDKIHQTLVTSEDFISANEFNKAKEHAVELLEKTWIRYLKEDMKVFIE